MQLSTARRIALAAQGFADPRPRSDRVDVRHFRRAMDRMQILQLDSVNVVARSHFLPMLARLGPFDSEKLDDWLWRSGENVEFLAHEASLTPSSTFPLLRYRQRHLRWRAAEHLRTEFPGYLESVLDEIERRGELSVSDLNDPGERTGPWWGNPKGKTALTYLFSSGQLAVAHRNSNFVTTYDLPGRVLTGEAAGPPLEQSAAERRLVEIGSKALGIGTVDDIADYFRLKQRTTRTHLDALLESGVVREVQVDGWEKPGYLHVAARRPRTIDACALLSPFDPVVWYRPRALRLFGFHYRIEIYTPKHKRVHGYYVLPFLLGDRLVGRVDVKADRRRNVLMIHAAFTEPAIDAEEIVDPLTDALRELAQFLGLDGLEIGDGGDLTPALAAAADR